MAISLVRIIYQSPPCVGRPGCQGVVYGRSAASVFWSAFRRGGDVNSGLDSYFGVRAGIVSRRAVLLCSNGDWGWPGSNVSIANGISEGYAKEHCGIHNNNQ